MTETTTQEASEQPLVQRDENGRLLPGSKLGRGRKKGSKNKVTLYREAMENRTSIQISKLAPRVLKKVGQQALEEGCRQSQKMILDRAVPVKKADDGDNQRDVQIEIRISSLTRDNVDEVQARGVVIDGEYETDA